MKKSLVTRCAPLAAFLLAAVCLLAANPFFRASGRLQDLLYQMPRKIMSGLYIIPAGDGTGASTLRQDAAAAIEALNADPDNRPAVIGVDVPLYGRGEPEADDALTQAVLDAGNVVLTSSIHYDHQIIRDKGRFVLSGTSISSVQEPVPPLDTAASGFTNVFLDRDGRMRNGMLRTEYEGEAYDHFAYAVYEKFARAQGAAPQPPPTDRREMWYVDFSGKAGAFHVGITWRDLWEGKVPASSFRGAIVLLCEGAAGTELFHTPLGKESATEVYANMIQALSQGIVKHRVPAPVLALVMVALLFGCNFLIKKGLLPAVATTAACVVGWPVVCMLLYHLANILLEPLYLPLLCVGLFVYHMAYDWVQEMRARVNVRRKLRRYLSPETANRLLLNHVSLEKPEKREIAVLFVDIRGFTPLSESLAPSQMAELLNEYLTLTSTAIFHNGGTLDKFIGDATMGFFNAPLDQDDYVYHAVKAAMEIAAGGERIRESIRKKFGRNIYFGIGVHFGSAVVGEIGSDSRRDYTAVGDTVNTASRLESNAGAGEVLVSLKVCEALEGRLQASFVGERQIKGKSKPMLLYRVDSLDGMKPPTPEKDP